MMSTSALQVAVADSLQASADQLANGLFSSGSVANVILTVAIIFGAWLVRRLVMSVVRRSVSEERTRYYVGKAVGYATLLIALFSIIAVWFEAFGSIGTFLGLLTAGVAIALRDLIADVAAWLFILTRRPFEIGDRIEIGGHRGDVVDISAFQFTILEVGNWVAAHQSTGRIIHIPNADVLRLPVANATTEFPFIWHELPVLVTFESDWRLAKKLLAEIGEKHGASVSEQAEQALKRATRKYLIRYTALRPTVYTAVQDSGILLTLRYLSEPRRRRSTAQDIWEDLLDAFKEHSTVDFAYPTTRTYLNSIEGKPGAREPLPSAWVGKQPRTVFADSAPAPDTNVEEQDARPDGEVPTKPSV